MRVRLKVFRYDPERDEKPHYQTYEVEADPMERLLDGLNRIRGEGYEVSVALEANISFSPAAGREGAARSDFDRRLDRNEPEPLKMTPLDRKFLRSLKISVEDEGD